MTTKVTASDVIALAESQVGYKETPVNFTKYNDWYYGYHASAEWCLIFQQWLFSKVGLPLPYKTASCGNFIDWAKLNKVWHTSGYKVGDMCIVQNPSSRHAVLITKVYTNGVDTIEGNWHNAVCKYYRTNEVILGVYHPEYKEEEDLTKEETTKLIYEILASEAKKRTEAQPSAWSAEDRAWAEQNGIIYGDNSGMHYEDYCTREQMTAFLHRLDKLIDK